MALPQLDLGDFSDLGYNDPGLVVADGASSSGLSYADVKGYIGDAVTLYGQVRSVTTQQAGTPVAQPVTIPAPQSPIGRDDNLDPSAKKNFFQRMADNFKVSLNVVYVVAGAVALGVVFLAYKLFKR